MMAFGKKGISIAVLLAAALPLAGAQASSLALTSSVTWASQYVVDGFSVGGRNPVWQIGEKLDLFNTGFSVMPWAAIQGARANKEFDEFDAFLLYSKDLFTRSALALNAHGSYDYWFFPNSKPAFDYVGNQISQGYRRGNKFNAGVSLIQALPLAGSYVVPTYNAYYTRYWAYNRSDRNQSGMLHEARLDYSRGIPRFVPGVKSQYFSLGGNVNYNGGVFGVRPGWSHATANVSTGVVALGSIIELGLNKQWTLERSVNPNNEFWTTLSLIVKL